MDDMALYALHGVIDGPDYSVIQNPDGSYSHQWKFHPRPYTFMTSANTVIHPWILRSWQRERLRQAHRRARLSTQKPPHKRQGRNN